MNSSSDALCYWPTIDGEDLAGASGWAQVYRLEGAESSLLWSEVFEVHGPLSLNPYDRVSPSSRFRYLMLWMKSTSFSRS